MKNLAPLAALLFSFALLACGNVEARGSDSRAAEPSAEAPALSTTGCGVAATKGSSTHTLTSGGIDRTYRLFVPSSYNPAQPTALVLNFHGLGGSGRQQEISSHMPEEAEKSGFITVAPDGTNNPRRWYIYGVRERGYVDDFAFANDLIDHLASGLCIDPKRIYSTGMSNGAGFSAQAGCRLNDRLAAVAPVAGSPFSAELCRGEGPMPVIAFHGTEDELIPFDGGTGGRLNARVRPVRENMKGWAGHNGCSMTMQAQRVASDVVLESYGSCSAGADVQLYVIEGGGHSWPGSTRLNPRGDVITQSIDATALIWQFFAAHPKP